MRILNSEKWLLPRLFLFMNPLSSENPKSSNRYFFTPLQLSLLLDSYIHMDSFNINIKVEKANAIKKHRQLQKIASLFRLVEICLVLALVSTFSVGLPVSVKNSSVYLKDLTVILASPRFVFIIGNAIVITLFAKSGLFSGRDSNGKKSRSDLYEEFVEKSERSQGIHRFEAEYREKKSSCIGYAAKKEENCASLERKKIQRSQSEKLEGANRNRSCGELRRTVTEKLRGSIDCSERWMKISYPEDRMSSEEFRCTVEAFIARQKRLRRDEEKCCIE